MALHTVLLLFISWSSMLHEGLGLPVLGQSEVVDEETAHRVRTKRCSCNNQLDYECHYFCHLDIIWVNTPSKTIVYGLGNALARRRRSAGRCLCASSTDQTCNNFCAHSTKKSAVMLILSEQSKSETPLSDLQGALTERHSNAPAVAAVEGSVGRVCADVPAFLRNMVIARTLKRTSAPTQRGSRVLRLSYR